MPNKTKSFRKVYSDFKYKSLKDIATIRTRNFQFEGFSLNLAADGGADLCPGYFFHVPNEET